MLVPEDTPLGDLDALGIQEYAVVDEETGETLVRASSPPMMLGPGLKVTLVTPVMAPQEKTPKRPGFLGDLSDYWEVLSPSGMTVALFRTRPHWTEESLTVKLVSQRRGARETLVVPGSAPFPAGTVRRRFGPLRTHRR